MMMRILSKLLAGVTGGLLSVSIMASAANAADKLSAVYVMSDNLGDMGFNDNAATGFARAEADGVRTRLLQASPSDPQLWRQNLEAVSNSGEWNIIFTGPNMHDNLAAVAPQHPEQKYVFFDDQLDLPNVLSVKYAQNEGSYLAGALAAIAATDKAEFPLSSGEPKIAVVAGMDLPVIQDFIVGFKQGAKTVVPNIEVQVIFIGNFNDAQKAYDLTKTAIENGANVVYNVAGPAGLGILKGAADAKKYAIGVDSDQNGLHPENVLASMLKQIGNSIYDSIGQVRDGKAEFGKLKIYGLANDGVGLVYNDALVPASVKAKIDEAKAKVVNGALKVETAFK
ncbi:BMP family ABC transporter substrate-binding protein [Mesorhizobium sp. AR07]|uniref:BMP family lipoprotein n=1 Tax=Mesorhizobium sp. AR07 TaxID=2865838 RepID=UPI00215E8EE7|nr:BMP family ABC transporter substrate-binding protein [Mesorhizobium sp. AR07]UVK45719.1 BMP family ABC transporter substrate-binding protein [Mesorhizobium sp. AR07]